MRLISAETHLPAGAELVRITDTFDQHTIPRGLLRAHRLAGSVWARLVVRDGTLDFAFDDHPGRTRHVSRGDEVVIPPDRPHRVLLVGPVRFALELYRTPPRQEPPT